MPKGVKSSRNDGHRSDGLWRYTFSYILHSLHDVLLQFEFMSVIRTKKKEKERYHNRYFGLILLKFYYDLFFFKRIIRNS